MINMILLHLPCFLCFLAIILHFITFFSPGYFAVFSLISSNLDFVAVVFSCKYVLGLSILLVCHLSSLPGMCVTRYLQDVFFRSQIHQISIIFLLTEQHYLQLLHSILQWFLHYCFQWLYYHFLSIHVITKSLTFKYHY